MDDELIIESLHEHLSDKKVQKAIEIQSDIRAYLGKFFREHGFIEVPPVIISPITDPLNHPVLDPSIDYYGMKYGLTKSMIFHKQILAKELGSIFTFSPNIRLETPEKELTGRHLSEFTQIDVEKRDASREEMMSLVEDLMIGLTDHMIKARSSDLQFLGRRLKVPQKPFRVFRFLDAEKEYGKDFEAVLSRKMKDPFWIIDIPLENREFYDMESDSQPGVLRDMDLIYPEGFGEGLSGGEREFLQDRIKERIRKKGQSEEQFKWILAYSSRGLTFSAGFGIGIERLTRYICGLKRIEDTHPFPKTPGKLSL
ncbi:MAG: asparagine synthetase A [Thermoplasmataceae archaeon]|jgi:asparaginyl-tRNA synthetase